ncbi:MAG: hypothetical protein KTR30_02035 [Saprospiraceae bacterium]|nr:hypothetical protein [Saprospiraceae bacterium]
MKRGYVLLSLGLLTMLLLACQAERQPFSYPLRTVSSVKIWDRAFHNAFVDMIDFKGQLLCTFREGDGHVTGKKGKIRVLSSLDGKSWRPLGLLRKEGIDLRNAKFSVRPDNLLVLTGLGTDYRGKVYEWFTWVSYSEDGRKWSPPRRVRGIPSNNWFYDLTWQDSFAYAIPMIAGTDPLTGVVQSRQRRMALYRTQDGMNYEQVGDTLVLSPLVGEALVRFSPDKEMFILIRDGGGHSVSAYYGHGSPPYDSLSIRPLDHGLGGPNLKYLPNQTWLLGTREWPEERPDCLNEAVTVFMQVYENGGYRRLFVLPSEGDTAYPGLVIRDDKLHITYYSGHEGWPSIYYSEVALDSIYAWQHGSSR